MKVATKKYLKSLCIHKKNVFKECLKKGLYISAFTYDLDMFLPKKFVAYRNWYYGPYGIYLKEFYNNKVLRDVEHFAIARWHQDIKREFNKVSKERRNNNKHKLPIYKFKK